MASGFPSGIPGPPFWLPSLWKVIYSVSLVQNICFPISYQSPLQSTSLSVLVIPPKHHPLGGSNTPHSPWISPLILTEEMPRVDTPRMRQVEDFICSLQLHLLWVAFSGSSIPFPIKLNSLLTGVPHGNGVDGIRRDSSLLLPSHPTITGHCSVNQLVMEFELSESAQCTLFICF